jgi:hypothetical protein
LEGKTFAMTACVLVTLSMIGLSYSRWGDAVTVRSTMSFGGLELVFVEPLSCGEYHEDPATGQASPGEYGGKDVGKLLCGYDEPVQDGGGYEALAVDLENAYPGYIVLCEFTLSNTGSFPIHINETRVSDPTSALEWDEVRRALVDPDTGRAILMIGFDPEPVCSVVEAGGSAGFTLTVQVAQDAEECHTYSFEVGILCEEEG